MIYIQKVQALEVLDSRGFPTVEVQITALSDNVSTQARAITPSGASTGSAEALEIRDHDPKRYMGKGVLTAIHNIDDKITPHLLGKAFPSIALFDDFLCDLDGTKNKSRFGANALLPLSMAFCRAFSQLTGKKLHQTFSECLGVKPCLPVPMMNIFNGGKHANNQLDIQEFMIIPYGFQYFPEALQAGVEVFHALKDLLHKKGLSTAVGDEGGFAPFLKSSKLHEHCMEFILEAIFRAGYRADTQIGLALDCAATEFVQSSEQGTYLFEKKVYTSAQLIELYGTWLKQYPILSIEDGLGEADWKGWKQMTEVLGKRCQLVGDDLFVTHAHFLQKGINEQCANAILIKLNQIGTVTQTLDTMKLAEASGYHAIVSHRSGETEDDFIADLAFGTGCGWIKTGSASRSDRMSKYNQLLRFALEKGVRFLGKSVFEKFH